ncbi:MAG TPA: PKD domain-containing protein, partial [Catalimonadaceae bacterium]|nr:PKD domain-containing protein [Catalimonadaceae bacterium]
MENQEVKQYVVFAKGGEKLMATLCWTDYQGTPGPAAYNSRTPMLVNNLNIRLQGPGVGVDSLPWKLDPENPGNGATKGNNVVDNVERVEFNAPVSGGIYTITVSHTGNLFTNATTPQNQPYSLIVTGIIAGDTNRTCLPMQYHNARTGRFDDGSGANREYFNGANCSWVINPEDSAAVVQVVFKDFNVHPTDTLYFYNGNQPGGELLRKCTGSALPDTIFSNTPQMYMNFKSDAANSAAGWEIEYSAIRKPKFTFTTASTSICAGDNLVLTAQNLDVDPPVGWSYSWSLPGAENFTMTGATVNPVYMVPGIYPVTLTVTNRFGPVSVTKTDYIVVKPVSTANMTSY